ncbi:hypothetical protein SZMC14600_16411 [Saccharomonospora azurea SZMC 14600]|nr:hypothetical protein SZMC14600_16411 [Saccharomonospora azurea SZMC 14600]
MRDARLALTGADRVGPTLQLAQQAGVGRVSRKTLEASVRDARLALTDADRVRASRKTLEASVRDSGLASADQHRRFR